MARKKKAKKANVTKSEKLAWLGKHADQIPGVREGLKAISRQFGSSVEAKDIPARLRARLTAAKKKLGPPKRKTAGKQRPRKAKARKGGAAPRAAAAPAWVVASPGPGGRLQYKGFATQEEAIAAVNAMLAAGKDRRKIHVFEGVTFEVEQVVQVKA
jgi:hypothetical protein